MPLEDNNNNAQEETPRLLGMFPAANVTRDVAVGCRHPQRDRVLAPFANTVQTRPGGHFED